MLVIAFHQSTPRIGTTTLAASFCEIARENLRHVAAVASGQSPDFEAWIATSHTRHGFRSELSASGEQIDCVPPAAAQPAKYALVVLDVPAGHAPPMTPTHWVLPVADPASLRAAAELTETLTGDIYWIGNRHHLTAADVPEHLRERVRVAPSIRKCRAPVKIPAARWGLLRFPRPLEADRPLALRDALERLFDALVPIERRHLPEFQPELRKLLAEDQARLQRGAGVPGRAGDSARA